MQKFWSRCSSDLKSKQLKGFVAAPSGDTARSCTVAVHASAEEKMMGRAGSSASSDEAIVVQRQAARPQQQEQGQHWACMARKFIWIPPVYFKAVVTSGRQSLQQYPPGLQVVSESHNKPYVLPEPLKDCRKALTKAFAGLPWPFTQGLISRGPWYFFSCRSWSSAYCWLLALLRDGPCSPYSLNFCNFHFPLSL